MEDRFASLDYEVGREVTAIKDGTALAVRSVAVLRTGANITG